MDQTADKKVINYSKHSAEQAFLFLRQSKPYIVEAPGGAIISLRSGVCVPDSLTFDFIEYCHKFIASHPDIKMVADLGTGSGVIAISLARLHPDRQFAAFDISQKALELANINAKNNAVHNLSLRASKHGYWISPEYKNKIDLIVSNPPFIGTEEWNSIELMTDFPDCRYQPALAMRAHDRYGLSEYLTIVQEANNRGIKWVIFRANGDYIDKLEVALRPQVKNLTLRQSSGKCPLIIAQLST